jgi:hypothetical protein
MKTNLLDTNGNAMIESTTLDGRDLTRHLKDSSSSKMNLFTSGIRRDVCGVKQNILFGKEVKKNVLVFNENAICPSSRYTMQAGEMWLKHGKLYLNIKLQQRIAYGI